MKYFILISFLFISFQAEHSIAAISDAKKSLKNSSRAVQMARRIIYRQALKNGQSRGLQMSNYLVKKSTQPKKIVRSYNHNR